VIVFEIRYPGTFPVVSNPKHSRDLMWLFSLLEGQATDAFVALNLFLALPVPSPRSFREQRQIDRAEREAIETELREEIGERDYSGAFDAIHREVERRFKHRRWLRGLAPRDYEQRLPFIYAHAFLYAVNSFGNLLAKLVGEETAPSEVQARLDDFRAIFPEVVEIRNSAQHIEDRGRGLGKRGKPLDLKPMDNRIAKAPQGGVVILGMLNNDRLGYTTANGEHAEIAISEESARAVRDTFQGILNAFAWNGPPRLLPN